MQARLEILKPHYSLFEAPLLRKITQTSPAVTLRCTVHRCVESQVTARRRTADAAYKHTADTSAAYYGEHGTRLPADTHNTTNKSSACGQCGGRGGGGLGVRMTARHLGAGFTDTGIQELYSSQHTEA